MELIKKEENKLFMSNYVGEAKFESKSGESLTYELMTTMSMSPVIKFPDGDTVIMNWDDIIKLAQQYKEGCYKIKKKVLEDQDNE